MKVAIVLNSPEKIKKVVENAVIYTDGGYKNRKYLRGKNTLALVGDFDTLKKIPKGVNIVRLNPEKDFTDGERAIRYAKEIGAESVTIYGAENGKIEHVLGNIALLGICEKLSLKAKIAGEGFSVYLASGTFSKKVGKGAIISLIPFFGECLVDDGKGLYYAIKNLTLTPSDTVGISNISTEEEISFSVLKGKVLFIIRE